MGLYSAVEYFPDETRLWPNDGLKLRHRLRCWLDNELTLGRCIILQGPTWQLGQMPTRKMIERSLTKPNGTIRWFWFVPCVWRVAVWRGTRRYGRVRAIFLHVTFTYEPDQLNCSPKHMHKHKMYWLDFYAGHSESERTVRNTMTYESLHTIQNCVGYARSELQYRRPKSKNIGPTILFMFIWSTCMSFFTTIRK